MFISHFISIDNLLIWAQFREKKTSIWKITFARFIEHTYDFNYRPTSFLILMTFFRVGVFLQITREPILARKTKLEHSGSPSWCSLEPRPDCTWDGKEYNFPPLTIIGLPYAYLFPHPQTRPIHATHSIKTKMAKSWPLHGSDGPNQLIWKFQSKYPPAFTPPSPSNSTDHTYTHTLTIWCEMIVYVGGLV